jgi:thiol-disulfide isomerase/thioredoxin
MNGLLFLTSDDFNVQEGVKGPVLCNNIQGFSMVLFYSKKCEWCKDLIPIFKKLPGKIGGCQFGMLNVNNNKKCILESRNTIDVIKVVPYVVLYVNGKPHMKYNGPHTEKDISDFIVEVASEVNRKGTIQQQPQQQPQQSQQPSIPTSDVTIGIPKCTDGVCYLDLDGAYGK